MYPKHINDIGSGEIKKFDNGKIKAFKEKLIQKDWVKSGGMK